eukprot:jgi/Astpho2/5380/Aster-05923
MGHLTRSSDHVNRKLRPVGAGAAALPGLQSVCRLGIIAGVVVVAVVAAVLAAFLIKRRRTSRRQTPAHRPPGKDFDSVVVEDGGATAGKGTLENGDRRWSTASSAEFGIARAYQPNPALSSMLADDELLPAEGPQGGAMPHLNSRSGGPTASTGSLSPGQQDLSQLRSAATTSTTASGRQSRDSEAVDRIMNTRASTDTIFDRTNDWEIPAEEIEICKHENGEEWRLGSGAYGTVYKALRDGVQVVAVKKFHHLDDPRQQRSIMKEVSILKGCRSVTDQKLELSCICMVMSLAGEGLSRDRNILQFLGASVTLQGIMLVTEFMESGDLGHALQRDQGGFLSWYKKGHQVMLDVARGLYFLHKKNILHMDMKSSNVLLARDATAKIADVGFSRLLSNTHLSMQSGAAGTYAYAAPEVLLNDRCDAKVDVYSFGVTLHELLTGEPPRRGQLRHILVPWEAPQSVVDLFNRCTAKYPTERPDIKEVVQVLQAAELEPPPEGLEEFLAARAAGEVDFE